MIGNDTTLPKEQMGQLRQVLISSFFQQVKEVALCTVHYQMNGWMDRIGWMDGWLDSWIGWMDGWMNEWMDGWIG
jgi:hypothetical protein